MWKIWGQVYLGEAIKIISNVIVIDFSNMSRKAVVKEKEV